MLKPLVTLLLVSACGRGVEECERTVEADMKALQAAEITNLALFDDVVAADPFPELVPYPKGADWGVGNAGFDELGWKPSGTARAQFSVVTQYPEFTAQALANCGDDRWSLYSTTSDKEVTRVWTMDKEYAKKSNEIYDAMRAEYKALHGKDADTSMLRKIQGLAMMATADIELMAR